MNWFVFSNRGLCTRSDTPLSFDRHLSKKSQGRPDDLAKNHQVDGKIRSSRCKARKSWRENLGGKNGYLYRLMCSSHWRRLCSGVTSASSAASKSIPRPSAFVIIAPPQDLSVGRAHPTRLGSQKHERRLKKHIFKPPSGASLQELFTYFRTSPLVPSWSLQISKRPAFNSFFAIL